MSRTGRITVRAMTVAVALSASSAIAGDGSFRCSSGGGSALVQPGDPADEVIEACGEPLRESKLENKYGATVGWEHVFEIGYGKANRLVRYDASGRVSWIRRID